MTGNRKNFDTLIEALNDLKNRGYTKDFDLRPYCLECPRLQLELGAKEFEVDEMHRFGGTGESDNDTVVYAISSEKGIKGVLVDACGACADSVVPEMARKLKVDTQP